MKTAPTTSDPSAKKRSLRRERWIGLSAAGAARFPGTFGRIPNFVGAESAAAIVSEQRIFQRAEWLKCNPDLPQRPLRYQALLAGKRISAVTRRAHFSSMSSQILLTGQAPPSSLL